MWNRKAIALSIAAVMLISTGFVLCAPTVSAADVTVALKKPIGGETWIMGKDYRVAWSYPNGGGSLIQEIVIDVGTEFVYSWSAATDPGPAPTSCIITAPWYYLTFTPGISTVMITVTFGDEYSTATDSREVNVIDGIAPEVKWDARSQVVVSGVGNTVHAAFSDFQSLVDFEKLSLTVDGRIVSGDNFEIPISPVHGQDDLYMQVDWLSLGKHRVTLTVVDYGGNVAKATMFLEVVQA